MKSEVYNQVSKSYEINAFIFGKIMTIKKLLYYLWYDVYFACFYMSNSSTFEGIKYYEDIVAYNIHVVTLQVCFKVCFQVCFQVCLLVIEGLYSSVQVWYKYVSKKFPKYIFSISNIFVRININPRSRVNILENILENIVWNILVKLQHVPSFPLS